MSFELIKVHPATMIGGESVTAVNLRDLHQALGSGYRFAHWAKTRLGETQADEGEDYLLQKKLMQVPSGAKHVIDFIVTIDLAKEIAMLERNKKGKEMRQYFIRIEKEFRAIRQTGSCAVHTESDHVVWLVRQLLKGMPADKLISLIIPRHPYGSVAENGKQRHGWRRPAFITQQHRSQEAKELHERGIVLKYLAQNLQLQEGGLL